MLVKFSNQWPSNVPLQTRERKANKKQSNQKKGNNKDQSQCIKSINWWNKKWEKKKKAN